MQTLIKHIKNNSYSNIYLLYGEEDYLIRYYRDRLTVGILGEEPDGNMNYHYYQGANAEPTEIATQSSCVPFFGDVQLLVIENSGLLKSSSGLADAFADLPESTYVIFVEKNIDKRNLIYKLIKEHGVIAEINHKNDTELVTWIATYLSHAGCLITKRAANLIILKAGTDMTSLANELEKLIAFVGDSKKIDVDEVEEVCTTLLSNKIFLMMDHIVSGRRKDALNIYRDLVVMKENTSNIIYLLTRHYNILLQMKDIYNMSDVNAAKKLSVPSFTIKKYRSQAAKFTKQELVDCITLCVETDEAIKTGKIPAQTSIEVLIVTLSTGK